jgi:hypothetical protein
VTTWVDLTTFTIQFNISNLEIDYLFILLPPTQTHTHVPSVPELDKSRPFNTGLSVIYVVFKSFEYYLKDLLNAILKTILHVIFYLRP